MTVELDFQAKTSIIRGEWREVKRGFERAGLNDFEPDEEKLIQEYLCLCRRCKASEITRIEFYEARNDLFEPFGDDFFARRGSVFRTMNDVLLPSKKKPVSVKRI